MRDAIPKLMGLLPTPTAMDSTNATANMKSTQVKEGSMHSVTLSRAMAMGMLPAPQVSDANQPEKIEKFIKRQKYHAEKGVNLQFPLRMMMQFGMLPTPSASDGGKNGKTQNQDSLTKRMAMGMLPTPTADDNPSKNTGKRNQDSLQKRAYQETGKTSQLNPRFVAKMMGFPPDWTQLPFQSGEDLS